MSTQTMINTLFPLLSDICEQIAKGDYNRAKQLFALTGRGEQDTVLEKLAESFGMMLVKIEAREFQLEEIIAVLNENQLELEEAKTKLLYENISLKASFQDLHKNKFPHKILGKSQAIQNLTKQLERIAQVSAHVLITGETGTGKGLAARAIHDSSDRAIHPFVSINCAAIPSSLLESELFGIEKGVASGVNARIGRFEQANKGTLFLDEIGDMPMESQVKILHTLENYSIERVGGRKAIPINVRIIAATHRNLETSCAEGDFRTDLYYRLNVLRVSIPPLRERKEDIPLLAKHFLSQCIRRNSSFAKNISKEALQLLIDHEWVGNIRELENEIERSAVMAKNNIIMPEDISFCENHNPIKSASSDVKQEEQKQEDTKIIQRIFPLSSLQDVERELVYKTLEEVKGNKSKAARLLGITREGLRKKLIRLAQNPTL